MRWLIALGIFSGSLILGNGQASGADSVALGLTSGVALGSGALLISWAAGAGLGRLLQHTRLEEERCLAGDASDWQDQMVGGQPEAMNPQPTGLELEQKRLFLWADQLPEAELLSELGR